MTIRKLMAVYRENEDLISVGAYRKGSNRTIDASIEMREAIAAVLQQSPEERCTLEQSTAMLLALGGRCQAYLAGSSPQPASVPTDSAA